jgi:hypothetical protein
MHLKRPRVGTELPEEYTRVTNPERFLPIQDFALNLLERLAHEYDVLVLNEFEAVPNIMRPVEHARLPITLAPKAQDEAPISVAFTKFPGLVLRCGKFFNESYPVCGCDGCGRDADEEIERLQRIIDPVVAGEFVEEVELPLFGNAYLMYRLGRMHGSYGFASSGSGVSRDEARALMRSGFGRIEWAPWSRKRVHPGAF